MKKYFEMMWKRILAGAGIFIFINFYLGVLLGHRIPWGDLIYLDVILVSCGVVSLFVSWRRWRKTGILFQEGIDLKHKDAEELLGKQMAEFLFDMEAQRKKDIAALTAEMNEQTEYFVTWAHEVKLPLASLKLMNERNRDVVLQRSMQDNLERVQQLLNTMMMSSKLNSLENDVRYEKLFLEDVIKEALKNQSYFLIHEHFSIQKELGMTAVYSDRRWLVYLLDQLIANAVKYRGEEPEISFKAEQTGPDEAVVSVWDNGIGILQEDIPYIFDKGYIGNNLRNGSYRSTGMGLYFVKKIAERLGIIIQVHSAPEKGTEFLLCFKENMSYFNLQEGSDSCCVIK